MMLDWTLRLPKAPHLSLSLISCLSSASHCDCSDTLAHRTISCPCPLPGALCVPCPFLWGLPDSLQALITPHPSGEGVKGDVSG